jgi:hypothetical protein
MGGPAWLRRVVPNASLLLAAVEGLDGRIQIKHPFLFEHGSERAIHLLSDPGGDGVLIGVFKDAANAVFTAEGIDANRPAMMESPQRAVMWEERRWPVRVA